MIKQTLQNAPMNSEITIRMNTEDMTDFKKTMQNEQITELTNAKLIKDETLKNAEFVIESPKGSVKAQIEEQLEQITNALKQAG